MFRASSVRPAPLRRALLFAGGLVLLWVAVQLAPSGPPPAPTAAVSAATALAQGAKATESGVPTRSERGLTFGWGQAAAVVLLAGGVGFALWLRRRNGPAGAAAPAALEAMGTLALPPHGEVRLVRAGDEVLLLGVTAGGITTLRRWPRARYDAMQPAPAPGALPRLAGPPPAAAQPPFADLLRHFAQRAA